MKKTNKGFTLIEMMLVVGIIALLSAIVIPRFNDFKTTAETETRNGQLAAIRTQLEVFKQETGAYPAAWTTAAWGSSVDDYWPQGIPADSTGADWNYDATAGTVD